jgi:hypothetical protein
MLQTLGNQPLQIVNALTDIREEWQTAARGASLLEVESNLGLLLVDILNHLNLPIDLQVTVLGNDLFQEMKDLLKNPSRN